MRGQECGWAVTCVQCMRVMWRTEGAMSSLLLTTLIELIESCMLYVSIIVCVSE